MKKSDIVTIKSLIYDLIMLVDAAQEHPHTGRDNYPEYNVKAVDIGNALDQLLEGLAYEQELQYERE